jgi:NTE family protein
MLDETTLVLGAGGPWGVAWMTGLLLGLEESGLAVRHVRAMVGSSAGAILGAVAAAKAGREQGRAEAAALKNAFV